MFAVATAFKVDKSEISKVSNSKSIFIQIRLMTPIFKRTVADKYQLFWNKKCSSHMAERTSIFDDWFW